MPSFNSAIRAAAAVAVLASGAAAGTASAAEHARHDVHARIHHVDRAHSVRAHVDHAHVRNAHWRWHMRWAQTRFTPVRHMLWWWHWHPTHPVWPTHPVRPTHPAPTPTTTTSTPTPTTTTPTTTTPTTTTPTPTTTTPTTPTPTTPTPTPTTPTTPTPTPTTGGGSGSGPAQPIGVSGSWNLTFDDEFNGTAINTSVWNNHDGWTNQNNVTDHASNVTESGGDAILTLASSSSGATIGTNQNVLGVGDFAEARVEFAGSGTSIYNWPAWWASGPNWPSAGENDIAEGLGTLTVNYHSPAGADNTGTVTGDWANQFHTYGIYRGSNYCNVYWDGQLVRHYSTSDNGQAEELLFTMGAANTLQFGAAGQMKVDYVRVWAPA